MRRAPGDDWLCLLLLSDLLVGLSQLLGGLQELPGLVSLEATRVHVTFLGDVLLVEEGIHKLLPFLLRLKDLSLQTPLPLVSHPQHDVELRDRQRADDEDVQFPLEKRFVDNVLELLLLLLVCPSLFKLEVEGVEIREFVELAFLSEWFGRRAVDQASPSR